MSNIDLILSNRSLAENNPLSLCCYDSLDQACERMGETRFIEWVNRILDEYE